MSLGQWEESRDERAANRQRRAMAGASARRDRDDPCLLCRIVHAPHLDGARRSGGDPDPRPLGKGRGLHGRRLCPHRRPAGGVHGPVGGCGQPRLGLAGRLSRAQPGDRADRAQGALVPAPQLLSGNRPRALVRGGDQVFGPGRCDRRIAAALTPRLAHRARRPAAADPSRFFRACKGDVIELGETRERRRSSTPRRGAFRRTGRSPTPAMSSAPPRP